MYIKTYIMDRLQFLKYKKYYLNRVIHNIILKKIILKYKKSFSVSSGYLKFELSDSKSIPSVFDFFLVHNKKECFNFVFLKNVIFYRNSILSNFFSNKLLNLVITFKFTKFNFFITPSSDSHPVWNLFLKQRDPSLRKTRTSLVSNVSRTVPITTFSAGQLSNKRKGRLKFEHFNIGSHFTVLIMSIFWSSLNKWTSKLFKFNIKIKGNTRWIRHIIRSVRYAFRKLHKEHRWYVKKNKRLYLNKSSILDLQKYNHSIQRLKQIVECPVFFNSLQVIKQLPHNGCRLKKVHLRCKDIKRINSRRMSR